MIYPHAQLRPVHHSLVHVDPYIISDRIVMLSEGNQRRMTLHYKTRQTYTPDEIAKLVPEYSGRRQCILTCYL